MPAYCRRVPVISSRVPEEPRLLSVDDDTLSIVSTLDLSSTEDSSAVHEASK